MFSISICAIIKNEARYLAEWIEYHLMLGVEHFYLYDNMSTDHPWPIFDMYRPYVTIERWPYGNNQQKLAYQDFVRRHASHSNWTAFIDADEFLVLDGFASLHDYLAAREGENGIMMQWVIFGTNGHRTRPEGLVLENYLMSYRESPTPNVKTICRANRIVAGNIASPHRFPYLDGRVAYPEHLLVLSVYHYVLRSRVDVVEKIARGDVWSADRAARTPGDIETAVRCKLQLYDRPDTDNPRMLRHIPELKERLRRRMRMTGRDDGPDTDRIPVHPAKST